MSYDEPDVRVFRGRDFRGTGRGENHRLAQLTEAQVIQIKKLSALPRGERPTSKALAERFGVKTGAIDNIRRGRTWTHVRIEDDP